MEPEQIVADIVAAAGGRLVSRIRLQKIAYLLEKLGAGGDLAFAYHHYGPYSRDLDSAILDAKAFGVVSEKFEHRLSDGAPYSVFTSEALLEHEYTYLTDTALQARVHELASVNVTVLELAATAYWLAREEQVQDWRSEIRRRKGSKTGEGRLARAEAILSDLGLTLAA